MNEPIQLLPCPFCGVTPDYRFEFGYECLHSEDCFINALPFIEGNRALKEWNTRTPPIPIAITGQIVRQQEQIKVLRDALHSCYEEENKRNRWAIIMNATSQTTNQEKE